MDDHKALAVGIVSGLRDLQTAQSYYDAEMWDISDPKFANLRHIQLHLAITVGKLARLLEPQDHRSYKGEVVGTLPSDEVCPIVADLVMHAAQIANIHGLDLGQALTERYRHNAVRFAPHSAMKTFGG